MNQKEIKAVAEIMKKNYGSMLIGSRKKFINDLADYFEREESYIGRFNREQFLKDCGVKT